MTGEQETGLVVLQDSVTLAALTFARRNFTAFMSEVLATSGREWELVVEPGYTLDQLVMQLLCSAGERVCDRVSALLAEDLAGELQAHIQQEKP